MLMDPTQSCVLLIDVQKKLIPLVHEHQAILNHCEWLIKLANTLDIPVLASEQYPKGLDQTHEQLKQHITNVIPEKVEFSVYKNKSCLDQLHALHKNQIIILGIEAHVCVLQTVLEFRQHLNKEIFVVADAIGSRHSADKALAIERMRAAGAIIVSREMVLFEWLRQAGTPLFKQISKEFLR